MKYGYIIYDWNGTLLDDTALCHTMLNEILERYSLPYVSLERYREIFTFPIRTYYERAGLDFDKCSYEELADRYVEDYMNRYRVSSLATGALEVLRSVKVPQFIISATKQSMLDEQIDHYGIRDYFVSVRGLTDHYADGKVGLARECTRELVGKGLWIGDTTHDMEVATACGCDCILLEGGHQCREVLLSSGAEVMRDFGELGQYLKEI